MHDCASILDSIGKKTSCFHYFCMVHPYITVHSVVLHLYTVYIPAIPTANVTAQSTTVKMNSDSETKSSLYFVAIPAGLLLVLVVVMVILISVCVFRKRIIKKQPKISISQPTVYYKR